MIEISMNNISNINAEKNPYPLYGFSGIVTDWLKWDCDWLTLIHSLTVVSFMESHFCKVCTTNQCSNS